MDNDIFNELKRLNEKVDALTALVTELTGAKKQKADAKKAQAKAKAIPLTKEDIERLQGQFAQLYGRWLENQEAAVREELEAMSPDDLRRLADANNLNVTAKTAKERVIQLIGFRFREKKQLTHAVSRLA